MVPASLIAYYISNKFEIAEGTLGTIMASAQFVSSIGNIFASSVAKRIGLVRTSKSYQNYSSLVERQCYEEVTLGALDILTVH